MTKPFCLGTRPQHRASYLRMFMLCIHSHGPSRPYFNHFFLYIFYNDQFFLFLIPLALRLMAGLVDYFSKQGPMYDQTIAFIDIFSYRIYMYIHKDPCLFSIRLAHFQRRSPMCRIVQGDIQKVESGVKFRFGV